MGDNRERRDGYRYDRMDERKNSVFIDVLMRILMTGDHVSLGDTEEGAFLSHSTE